MENPTALPPAIRAALTREAAPAEPDSIPALVDQWMPLFREYDRVCERQREAQERQARLGHPTHPFYFIRSDIAQYLCDVNQSSEIEKYYAKCIDQAETPAQRAHLRERCAYHIEKAREYWEQWSREHRECGLAALDDEQTAAQKACESFEEKFCDAQPRSMAEAIALLRYAHATRVGNEDRPDFWDFPDQVTHRVISFLDAGGAP